MINENRCVALDKVWWGYCPHQGTILIKLFSSDDMFLMQSLKSELDALAIPYMIKNEYASGAMGELPWQDTQPELWLIDDT